MEPKKKSKRLVHISEIIDLSPHLRRIILTGPSLKDFPAEQEGAHVKVILQDANEAPIMRSYTIRFFNPKSAELALDFVVNRHTGPATNWAKSANVGDSVHIAGPGSLKLSNFDHTSYLLVGDITSVNAINGYVPRFKETADIRVVVTVPTRADIIEMDYNDSKNTEWFIEDEESISLEAKITNTARDMAKDTHVFLGLEARSIRSLRPVLQEELGFDRLNIYAVGYWKKGVNADRFSIEKKSSPL